MICGGVYVVGGHQRRSPAPSPSPLLWTRMSRTVICRVTQESHIMNCGR